MRLSTWTHCRQEQATRACTHFGHCERPLLAESAQSMTAHRRCIDHRLPTLVTNPVDARNLKNSSTSLPWLQSRPMDVSKTRRIAYPSPSDPDCSDRDTAIDTIARIRAGMPITYARCSDSSTHNMFARAEAGHGQVRGLSCQNAGFILGRPSGERATHFAVKRRSQGRTDNDREACASEYRKPASGTGASYPLSVKACNPQYP